MIIVEYAMKIKKQLVKNWGITDTEQWVRFRELPILYDGNNYLLKIIDDTYIVII